MGPADPLRREALTLGALLLAVLAWELTGLDLLVAAWFGSH